MALKDQKITVVNKLTGEIFEYKYRNIEEAEAAYLEVKAMSDALDRAKKKLNDYIAGQVEDRHQFDNGYTGRWISGQRRRYLPEIVRKYLDEDQLDIVTEINGTKLKKLFGQFVEDGVDIPGAWQNIEANAEVTLIKAYFVIKKD